MGKGIKKVTHIAFLFILVAFMMLALLYSCFQFKTVQTWAAQKATTWLSKKIGTTVGIKSLYLRPFSSVVLQGFYVLDKQHDTLISAPTLTIEPDHFSIITSIPRHYIAFKTITLDDGSVYLKHQTDHRFNFRFIIDSLSSRDTSSSSSSPWKIVFETIRLNNLHFRYQNQSSHEVMTDQVNLNDIDLHHVTGTFSKPDFHGHFFKGQVTDLSLRERSGFVIKHLSSFITVDSDQIVLKQLSLITPHSSISNFFRMSFRSFDDFDNFYQKVYMEGNFRSSKISSADVSYFTNNLQHTSFDLLVNGRIRGPVDNLTAKNLTVSSGQATYIRGDFNLRGLPDWDHTYLDLKFDQIATNKKDIDLLFTRFTGRPATEVPVIFSKFGNINFSGQFNGFQSDFVAYGGFKTKLGAFNCDIELKTGKTKLPQYSGKVSTNDFDLGSLIDEQELGHTSFNADIKGKGDKLDNISEYLKGTLQYFDFHGYRYKNLAVNGTFSKKQFDGKIKVNDENLGLDFDGAVNLNAALPVFNFTASINRARLNVLKISNDTVTVSANVTSNFSGNNLNNIEGQILLKDVHLQNPYYAYRIDSVFFSASGSTTDRVLNLRSDLADGSLHGNFDLATLPSYFKTIVKKYLPSLKTDIVPPAPQNFQVNIKIKDLDPFTQMFLPDLEFPDQGDFVGQFNSAEKKATLAGSIKTMKYKHTVFHDMIIDESTNDDKLNLNLSVNRINFTDSLFIKDINIANFVKHDSVDFNIKLSDKNAVNQLDLYGLVALGADSSARLILLPSDVILEHKVWRLKEKSEVKFDGHRTQVSGFELSNGLQKVKIDGSVSQDPQDVLHVNFDKFGMDNLNQLSKSEGVFLTGQLNGGIDLATLTTTPGVMAHLNVDSLGLNKVSVGKVKLDANYDNVANLANINMNIINRGLETLNASGSYNIHDANNSLNFTLKMNQTEAIILQPFVKHLVSNITGTLSSDLKLTGTFLKPRFDGAITLSNTGVTVNYLKTHYTINEQADVENSILNITNLILKDDYGGQGIANGSIDLSADVTNPVLNIDIDAKNILALNTTFKDNRLYYGTAFGTGTFGFAGPIDNMQININAKTESGTVFNIPLNTSSTASDYDFIRFVSSTDTTRSQPKSNAFKGVTLNFNLSADEKTTVKIYTDYGNLTGNGVANNLSLKINSFGDFEMFGDYLISTGKFEFTAKNVISKNFTVNQGGTIRWTGNPANAEININAIYEVRTDVSKLYQAAGLQSPQGNQVKLVQAELLLSKALIQPNIDFDFNFPADPSIKDELGTYLNDPTNRSQQALSLIVRRNFAPGTGNGNIGSQVTQTAEDAVSELAFNTINTFISQTNIKNLDVNIRSANEASLSAHFFNDRLSLNTSVSNDQTNNQLISNGQTVFNSSFSNLTKDFAAQYRLRKDGRLMATYSYRVLNSTTLNTINDQLAVQYVNGIGLVYSHDFDSFGELFRRTFGKDRNSAKTTKPDSSAINAPAVKKTQLN